MGEIPPERLAAMAKEDQGPLTKSIVIAFTIIAFICVCLRLFTRLRYLGRAVGWEDYTIIISMLASIITTIFQILESDVGMGKHAVFVPFPDAVTKILKYLFWSIIFYNVSLTLTKISILLQYGRIFTVREMRIPLHVTMGICVLWGIATMFTSILSCIPVNAYWQVLEKPRAKCIDQETVWYVNASINIATDLLVAFLPVRVIWTLQIAKRQKIALLGILTIGWFVCVVSILRLHALVVLAAHPDDNTWYSSATAYWSSIEINLAIVCASLPALKPLIVKLIPGFSTRHSSGGYGTGLSARHTGQNMGMKGMSRRTVDDNVELGRSISTKAYPSTSADSVFGKNIYVSRHFEQHFEENGQVSDSESQKDLVAEPKSVFEKH